MPCIRLVIGERERAYLVVLTADFSLYIFIYISGAGRHHTVMFYVILNTRTNVKFHKSSTKLGVLEARLRDGAAQQSSTHRCFSRTGLVGLEPPKQPTEVSMLVRKAENPLGRGASRD